MWLYNILLFLLFNKGDGSYFNFLTRGIYNSRDIKMNTRYNNYENFNSEQNKNTYSLFPIQSGSLRTWSYKSPDVERVKVNLKSDGRPVDASVELWNGPNNTPSKMRVYLEDGNKYNFNSIIETPKAPNTIAIKNTGEMEFPISANIHSTNIELPTNDCYQTLTHIQSGAIKTFPFDPRVESIKILLNTDGRPLNSRIELLQGPNNNKQVIEIYNEDGYQRPFYCILETPGSGNVVRVINTSPVEFPMLASVIAHSFVQNVDYSATIRNY